MSSANLAFTQAAEEEHGRQVDPGLVFHLWDGLILYSDSRVSLLKRTHSVQRWFFLKIASLLRTEVWKAAPYAWRLTGHAQLIFVKNMKVEDDACIVSISLAERFRPQTSLPLAACYLTAVKIPIPHRDLMQLWVRTIAPFPIQLKYAEESQMAATAVLFFCLHSVSQERSFIAACSDSGENKGEIAWRSSCRCTVRRSSVQLHGVKWYEGRSAAIRPAQPLPLHQPGGKWYDPHKRVSVLEDRAELEIFQIFVKSFPGKTLVLRVSPQDTGETLKTLFLQKEGISRTDFYFMHEGKVLHEGEQLRDRQIHINSTIHMGFRLRGGSSGNRGAAGPFSYKEAARPKGPQSAAPPSSQPRPYIVEKLEAIPSMEVKNKEVSQLFKTLQSHALICRFNGFWPKSCDLHEWIYTNWTTNCQILLCSKGFFVVQFETQEEYQKIIEQGPWFWGRAGLFLTPWFPEFDANSMVVTKMPVWVRLPNLPLPFWHLLVLEDIGNLLGKHIKSDTDRLEQGLFTYARICVEIDLSKGLPDRIQLIYEKHKWLQALDYENTAFRCRLCHLTGHLQDTCHLAKRYPKKKQGMKTKGKTWQADYAPSLDESSEGEQSEPEEKQEEEANEETVQQDETMETHHPDPKNPGQETATDNMQLMATSVTGSKRAHESESSDSDKEKIDVQPPVEQPSKEIVTVAPQQGGWTEVKSKKRGKKGKLEDYYKIPSS